MIFKNLFHRRKPTETTSLIVVAGLGNPGQEYEQTRHNAGFLALDNLQEKFRFDEFQEEKKFQAMISRGTINERKIILLKPLTFMNASGESIRALLSFYKLSPHELIVIHDDVDLTPGTLRTTDSSSSAGHNGVQNIIDTLGTQDFKRIRIGIGRPEKTETGCLPVHEYVLQKFTPEEQTLLNPVFETIETTIATWMV